MIRSGLNISRQKQEVYDLTLGELPLLKDTSPPTFSWQAPQDRK